MVDFDEMIDVLKDMTDTAVNLKRQLYALNEECSEIQDELKIEYEKNGVFCDALKEFEVAMSALTE